MRLLIPGRSALPLRASHARGSARRLTPPSEPTEHAVARAVQGRLLR